MTPIEALELIEARAKDPSAITDPITTFCAIHSIAFCALKGYRGGLAEAEAPQEPGDQANTEIVDAVIQWLRKRDLCLAADHFHDGVSADDIVEYLDAHEEALIAAAPQPPQEPVAWRIPNWRLDGKPHDFTDDAEVARNLKGNGREVTPLYAAPLPPEPVGEEDRASRDLSPSTCGLQGGQPQSTAQWRPIAEAPRDGTVIVGRIKDYSPIVVSWRAYSWGAAGEERWRDCKGQIYRPFEWCALPPPFSTSADEGSALRLAAGSYAPVEGEGSREAFPPPPTEKGGA